MAPPQNIFKGYKSNKLPGLVDTCGRGYLLAIIKPVKRIVYTTESDEIFESEEGDFSD